MKYLKSKPNSIEESILQMWEKAAKQAEDNTNDKSDDGEGMDKVQPKALKKKFKDRKDKDIDNDGDVDSTDKYLHTRRKAISKAIKKENFDVGTPENTKSKLAVTPGQSADDWEQQVETIQKKNASMRERLAKIWDMDEGKNPFEKEKKEEVELDEKVKEYKGVAYFKTRKDAEAHMKKFAPKGRVVEYERGYAVQTRIAGPYLNKAGKTEEVELGEKKKEEKNPKKAMTGEPVTKIEVDPKINDK